MVGSEFRIRNRWINALLLALLIAGTGYVVWQNNVGTATEGNGEVRKMEENIFGTVMHVTYTSPTDLHDSIMAALHGVDASLSMFNPKSTLALINSGESDRCDSLLAVIVPFAAGVSEATEGAFDITVAPLVNAWGFGFKNGALPTDQQVDSLKALVDYRRIHVTEDGRLVKEDERMVIDLSAIAKGFGTDQVARCLQKNGVEDFMVEIGGEIVCHGSNPNGKAWHVGITRPDDGNREQTNDIEEVLSVHDQAMATSGNYRNFYVTEDGRRLAHTIDPHSGRPVQHNILSSTVLAPTCTMADAYATAFMVMGLDDARKVLEKQPLLHAYFICSDKDGKYSIWHNLPEEFLKK